MQGIMLGKQGRSFILMKEKDSGFHEIGKFENIGELKQHLSQTGTKIRWYSDTISSFDIFFHLRKYQDTSVVI